MTAVVWQAGDWEEQEEVRHPHVQEEGDQQAYALMSGKLGNAPLQEQGPQEGEHPHAPLQKQIKYAPVQEQGQEEQFERAEMVTGITSTVPLHLAQSRRA